MGVWESLYRSPVGRALAPRVGLAPPPELRRGRTLPAGPVALQAVAGARVVADTLTRLGVATIGPLRDDPGNRTTGEDGRERPPSYGPALGALLIDATGVRTIAELEELRVVLRPAMRGLEPSGRIVLVGTDAAALDGLEGRAVAQALDGLNRTVAKELHSGATANLVYLADGAGAAELASTLAFLLEGRSAFVSGQSWRVGPAKGELPGVTDRPFEGRIAVVTGAARGIGADIARTFARDGARVVCVDVPAAGDALARVANEVGGVALQLDITRPDAGARLAERVARLGPDARLDALVHCAGITRDKLLANLDERRWAAVMEVNLAAQLRINAHLLALEGAGGFAPRDARIVSIASTSGIAGNRGQANYAASKAGVMGLVRGMSRELADRPITVNAVAPGFIETDMTAAIPFVQREVFRRTNSLQQGGLPVDVAEAIAYLAQPASGGVDGQVLRVCGQNVVGA